MAITLYPVEQNPSALLFLYPVICAVAAWRGLWAALVTGSAAVLVSWTAVPLLSPFGISFLVTLILTGMVAGVESELLRRTISTAEEEKRASLEFAAALHLRLTLAEREIDRLSGSSESHNQGESNQSAYYEPPPKR